ncbi:hypothetical protein FACS1894124_4600 [Spirochaetia bacterium]|nr:hypothetical protein FACS1894124_4600 [Spirochaetia bacterium]
MPVLIIETTKRTFWILAILSNPSIKDKIPLQKKISMAPKEYNVHGNQYVLETPSRTKKTNPTI